MNITDIQPGTRVRITTNDGAPFVNEGDILTVIDPDAHWEKFIAAQDEQAQVMADLLGPPPAWPSDAIAVDHDLSLSMGPAAFREGEFEIVEELAA